MNSHSNSIRCRPAQWLALCATLGAVLAGCGGSNSYSSPKPSSTSAGATAPTTSGTSATGTKVTIASFMFTPATLTVKKGTTVTFKNRDNASHTATADGGSFDSGTLAQGSSKAITFSTPGRFTYHCGFHPFMHGTVLVQ